MSQPRFRSIPTVNLSRLLVVGLSLLILPMCLAVITGCAPNTINNESGGAFAPNILIQPVDQTAVAGQNVAFGVSALGNGSLTYQWFMNGDAVSGATSSSFVIPTVPASDSGAKIYVVLTDTIGTTTSNTATLTVNALPPGSSTGTGSSTTPLTASIACSTTNPAAAATVGLVPTFTGGTATIGTTGSGSSDITASAVSGNTYNSAPVTAAQTYTLTVSNSTTKVTATCKATPTQVTITNIQPNATTLAPGTINLTATVNGGATNQVTWSATGGSFTGNAWTTPTATGAYTLTATSVDQPAVHANATITLSVPVITKQPAALAVCAGSAATLSVTANYATAYQWSLNGNPILGATASSYLIPSASATDAGTYTVTATNLAGAIPSSPVAVTVGSAIAADPANITVGLLQPATFSVSATGKSPFTYQWYLQPAGGSSFTAVPGATASSYTTTPVSDSNGSEYYVVVKDGCGTTFTTPPALLGVSNFGVPPLITLQPVGANVPVGGSYTFTTNTSSASATTYQWFRVPAGSDSLGVPIDGANALNYTVPPSDTNLSNDQDGYYMVATNASGVDVSNTAVLAVNPGISISQQPVTIAENAGETAVFSVNASSTMPITYQWFTAPPGSSTFAAIPGATSSTYTIPATAATQNGSAFYATLSNGDTAKVTSTTAGLFVSQLPVVTNLCDAWTALGYATPQSGCGYELVPAKASLAGAVVWPHLVPTTDMSFSFTVTTSNATAQPGEGFALVLGDPTLGATPKSLGSSGLGLGAQGIPGFAFTFNIDNVEGAPPPPFLANTYSAATAWGNPWLDINNTLSSLAAPGVTVTHVFNVSILGGLIDITMDGAQIFHGNANLPPVAYVYFTAGNGTNYEQVNISNLTAIFAPQ